MQKGKYPMQYIISLIILPEYSVYNLWFCLKLALFIKTEGSANVGDNEIN